MKLQLMSDVHLEFGAFYPEKTGDVLLLAGDILVAECLRRNDEASRKHNRRVDQFFDEFVGQFDDAYMVMGNHEYYGGIFPNELEFLQRKLPNVKILENEVVHLNNEYAMWAGTFWTDLDRKNWFVTNTARKNMNDYHVIHTDDDKSLSTEDTYNANVSARESLARSLSAVDKKFVVMTHHGLLTPPRGLEGPSYSNDNMDFNFFNTNIELPEKVTHYVHGHTHDSYDYTRHGVRVVVNPRGYHGHALNPNFDSGKVIEI